MTPLFGVDFTSAPRRAKPITVAHGRLTSTGVVLEQLESIPDWPRFDALLSRPGPWLGAFDFPFGLPRDGVRALAWPDHHWATLVRHVGTLDRTAFRAALDADRKARPMGARYPHRHTDAAARSHSPMKLVNPPVGLMFFEGAPRLLEAGVSIPGVNNGDPNRIAVEAYPGLLARAVTRQSYKSDTRSRQNAARYGARTQILAALEAGTALPGLTLGVTAQQRALVLSEGSGDLLDAALALMQAGWCEQRRSTGFGRPEDMDPLEGWIATT